MKRRSLAAEPVGAYDAKKRGAAIRARLSRYGARPSDIPEPGETSRGLAHAGHRD